MAERGIYSAAEKQMLDATEKMIEENTGWDKLANRPATIEEMTYFSSVVDCWNPLWNDRNYAKRTRWGDIIAFPMFQERFGEASFGAMPDNGKCGYQSLVWIGEDWSFYRPIRPGDSIKVWNHPVQIKDVTSPDGKGPRRFGLRDADRDYINQNDELLCNVKSYVQRTFYQNGLPEPPKMPDYGYTEAEFEYLNRIMGEEIVRGSKVRYWEDVNVKDAVIPIVVGPTSLEDTFVAQLQNSPNPTRIPARRIKIEKPGEPGRYMQDPQTKLIFSAQLTQRKAIAQGDPNTTLPARLCRNSMIRMLTNWIGDDGYIKKFNWRHVIRTLAGDAMIGYGTVIKKYLENDEHLVDIEIHLENLRGNITEMANATVRLCGKEKPFNWKTKQIC